MHRLPDTGLKELWWARCPQPRMDVHYWHQVKSIHGKTATDVFFLLRRAVCCAKHQWKKNKVQHKNSSNKRHFKNCGLERAAFTLSEQAAARILHSQYEDWHNGIVVTSSLLVFNIWYPGLVEKGHLSLNNLQLRHISVVQNSSTGCLIHMKAIRESCPEAHQGVVQNGLAYYGELDKGLIQSTDLGFHSTSCNIYNPLCL